MGSTGTDAIRHPGTDDDNADHHPADVTIDQADQADHPDPDQPNQPDRNDAVNVGKPDDARDTNDTDHPDADRKPNDTEPNALGNPLGNPLGTGDADPGRNNPHGDVTDPVSRFGGRL